MLLENAAEAIFLFPVEIKMNMTPLAA